MLVNNAGSFVAGFFEELLPKQIEQQLAVMLLGPMNVMRQIQKRLEPAQPCPAERFDIFPIIRSRNDGTQRNHQDMQ